MLPGVAGGVAQVIVVGVAAVGPMVAAQIVPEVLDGVELRRVRRQRDQREVRWRTKIVADMEAGLIPEHHDMHMRIDLADELLEEGVDGGGVERGGQQADGLAGVGTGRAQDVEVVVLGLLDGRGPRAASGPLAGQGALLAEAGFILEPDLDRLTGVRGGDLLYLRRGVFLKASTTAGSFLGCRGRGESHS